jgi:hypothetical protein
MERVHDRDRVREDLGGSGLEAREPVNRDHLDALPPGLRARVQPDREGLLRASLDHVQRACGSCPGAVRHEVHDHGDGAIPAACVSPDVLIDADRGHTLEASGIIDQDAIALGQDRGARGVPGDAETGSDSADRQVVDEQAGERPGERGAGELRSGRGHRPGVLPEPAPAVLAVVAADPLQQRARAVPERGMRGAPRDRSPRSRAGNTRPTPRGLVRHAAFQDCTVRLDELAGANEADLVQAREDRQVRRVEGAWSTSRSSRWRASELPSSGDLDVYPGTNAPTPPTGPARGPTPSTAKSRFKQESKQSAQGLLQRALFKFN